MEYGDDGGCPVVGDRYEYGFKPFRRTGEQFYEPHDLQPCAADRSRLPADRAGSPDRAVFRETSGYPEGVCSGILSDTDRDEGYGDRETDDPCLCPDPDSDPGGDLFRDLFLKRPERLFYLPMYHHLSMRRFSWSLKIGGRRRGKWW